METPAYRTDCSISNYSATSLHCTSRHATLQTKDIYVLSNTSSWLDYNQLYDAKHKQKIAFKAIKISLNYSIIKYLQKKLCLRIFSSIQNVQSTRMFHKSGNDIKHSIPNKTYSKLLSEAMYV